MLAIIIKTQTEVDQRACLEHAVSSRDRLAFSQWPDQHTLFPGAVPIPESKPGEVGVQCDAEVQFSKNNSLLVNPPRLNATKYPFK